MLEAVPNLAIIHRERSRSGSAEERYRLGDQLLRAARFTTANIAERYGRFHYLDNAKFCSNARGWRWEVLDHLITENDEESFLPNYLIVEERS
jgi:four helix bundle protein